MPKKKSPSKPAAAKAAATEPQSYFAERLQYHMRATSYGQLTERALAVACQEAFDALGYKEPTDAD